MACTFHKCELKITPSCPTFQNQLLKLNPAHEFDKVYHVDMNSFTIKNNNKIHPAGAYYLLNKNMNA